MTTVNFPATPLLNQEYTYGDRKWKWNGRYWQASSVTIGYTGSKGEVGAPLKILGNLPNATVLPGVYNGSIGDGYIVQDTGNLWIWNGIEFEDVGRIVGYTGSTGNLGYTGSTGALGYVGSRGEKGFSGSQGAPGSDGVSVAIVGAVANSSFLPIPYLGNIGDGYIAQDTGFLWIWSGAAWANAGRVVGYTGSIGYTGSAGPQGISGEFAGVGFTGSAGLKRWTVVNANVNAGDTDRIIADTSGGAFSITLPSSPISGTYIQITDGANFFNNNLTVLRNGSTIEGQAQDVVIDIPGATFEFVYTGTTWQVTATAGPKGDVGYTGSRGLDGTSVDIKGAAATAANLPSPYGGVAGDGYITQNDGHLHVWSGSVWVDVGNIEGPAGFTGSRGGLGYTGSKGDPGEAAAIGYTGSSAPAVINLYQSGTLTVNTGSVRWCAPYNLIVNNIKARVITAADSDIIISIRKNNSIMATITIAALETAASDYIDVISLAYGDYLTVGVEQIGTTAQAGTDLYVQFRYQFLSV